MKFSQAIMAIYPNGRGFGFALMASPKDPIDARTLEVAGTSHKKYLKRIRDLLTYYKPTVLIVEDPETSQKSKRITKLIISIANLSKELDLPIKKYSREQIKEVFASFNVSTRFEIASCIHDWFPNMGLRLPRVKKIWESEDFTMAAYDALSLALTHYYLEE